MKSQLENKNESTQNNEDKTPSLFSLIFRKTIRLTSDLKDSKNKPTV